MSGVLSAGGAARAIIERVRHGEVEVVSSGVLLDELEEVLERFLPRTIAGETRVAFEELCDVVRPEQVPRVSRDPDDDHVVAAAVVGNATVVVTRDHDLLTLGAYQGITFLEPVVFLEQIRRE